MRVTVGLYDIRTIVVLNENNIQEICFPHCNKWKLNKLQMKTYTPYTHIHQMACETGIVSEICCLTVML